MRQAEIIDHALHGVRNAFSIYYKWSGGYWLGWAPEGFLQVEIARAIKKVSPYITLEDTVDSLLDEGEIEKRGPKPRGTGKGRVDITIRNKNESPTILIEVKRGTGPKRNNEDIKRLKQLTRRRGSIKYGLHIVYTSAKNPETIDKQFAKIANRSHVDLYRRLGPIKFEDWYWDAGCFLIRGKE